MSEAVYLPKTIDEDFLSERLTFLYSGEYSNLEPHDQAGHKVLAEDFKINRNLLLQREQELVSMRTPYIVTPDTNPAEKLELSHRFLGYFAETPYVEDESTKMRWSLPDETTGKSPAQERYESNLEDARKFVAENLQDIILIAANEARSRGVEIKTSHLYLVR